MAALFRRLTEGALAAVLVTAATGCYSPGHGVDPPLNNIYFPVGMAVSPGGTRLYVANSDFDLQYNAGSLQSYDLERLRQLAPHYCNADADCASGRHCDLAPTDQNGGEPSHWCVDDSGPWAGRPCGALGDKSASNRVLEPGRCSYLDPVHPQDGGAAVIRASVGIGAFATNVLYIPRPPDAQGNPQPGGRLFIPVRGDATLHYVEVDDDAKAQRTGFELECGQQNAGGNCDEQHRVGDNPSQENTRGLRLPTEPFGIAATPDGSAIAVTHQTEGKVSLFVNDASSWGNGTTSFGTGPKLEFIVGNMPTRPIGIAQVPPPEMVTVPDPSTGKKISYQPGFLVTYRNAAQVRLFRYYSDAYASSGEPNNPARPFIAQSGSVDISANAGSFDSRGIAVDASERQACERRCDIKAGAGAASFDCLHACAGIPLGVYIANRTPSSLLVGQTRHNQSATSSDDLPSFYRSVPLPFGPSRVIVGDVIGSTGLRERRVFVVCFDSRRVGIYNPDTDTIEKWIETGRGPHAFAVDIQPPKSGVDPSNDRPGYAFAYIGHFTDSWIGMIDLDQRHPTYGEIVMTIGNPTAPRASK